MKIQECYVENFGGLSGYHFCPEEPLEYLCAPNGSGKTTFAAFVCAMFYGLGSARTRKNLEAVAAGNMGRMDSFCSRHKAVPD